jgi:hypothetical protein
MVSSRGPGREYSIPSRFLLPEEYEPAGAQPVPKTLTIVPFDILIRAHLLLA